MCELCTVSVSELLLAETTRELILAETDAGLSGKNAIRPLNPNERRAGVKFGLIEKLEDDAVTRAADAIGTLTGVIGPVMLGNIFGKADEIPVARAADMLAAMNKAQPKPVADAEAEAARVIEQELEGVYSGASELVVEEARRQKVTDVPEPKSPLAGAFAVAAGVAAGYMWTRLVSRVQTVMLDPATVFAGSVGREAVAKIIDDTPPDGAVDVARQSVHAAQGLGRNDTAEELNPGEIWASELLDGNTCRACAAVDGKEYDTLAAAREDYPHGGYYACDGGARCRGTLVFMYADGDPAPDVPFEPVIPDPPAKKRGRRAANPVLDTPSKSMPKLSPDGAQRFTKLDQLPKFTDKKAAEITASTPDELRTLATKVNPMRPKITDRSDYGYSMNCTNCVSAYEMRRRGFDVNAARIETKGRNSKTYLQQWWKTADGGTPPDFSHVSSRRGLETWAKDYPDGARGYVEVVWKGRNSGAHVFTWEKVNGKIVYVEPQSPSMPDAERHFARVRAKHIWATRVDNLTPTDSLVTGLEIPPK